eukprot:278901-Karenia_brevis.AAC.1
MDSNKGTAPASWAEYFPDEDTLVKEKKRWLTLNARRHGSVQCMIPLGHGMPVEILNGSSTHCKEYGVHTRSTGT